MKLPAHARRLAILAGLGIILSFGSAQVRADEPQVSPDEALRRVAESLEAADVPPETRGRILDLIRSRQAAKPNDGPGAGEAGDEGGGPQPAPERAQRPASPGRDPQAIREKLMRDRQIFWERLRQAALEADREAEEARLRAERLRAHAERAMSAAAQADRGEDPLGGEAERGGRPGGPGMDPFGPPRQAGGFEIGIVFDLRKGEQLAIAEVADGSAAEVAACGVAIRSCGRMARS